MKKLAIAASAVLLMAGGVHAVPTPGFEPQKAKSDPAARKAFEALKAEFDEASAENRAAMQQVKTVAERSAVYAKRPNADEYARRFKAIAEKYPKDRTAASAWAWIAQNSRTPEIQAEALDGLLANHVASPEIGRLCGSLHWSRAANLETFLRTVLEKSTHHETQGHACYALARMFLRLSDRAARAKADPSIAANIEELYGKEHAEKIAGGDPAAFAKEAGSLFDRVVAKYADVQGGKLADQAKLDLFELRNLAVGQKAPEIVGEDENGNPIQLSSFRGKGVMLGVWGSW